MWDTDSQPVSGQGVFPSCYPLGRQAGTSLIHTLHELFTESVDIQADLARVATSMQRRNGTVLYPECA